MRVFTAVILMDPVELINMNAESFSSSLPLEGAGPGFLNYAGKHFNMHACMLHNTEAPKNINCMETPHE